MSKSNRSPGLVLGLVILGLLLSLSGMTGESMDETTAPNRARWAKVTASSLRLARMGEIPRAGGVLANLQLSLPQTRPRWIPRYAIDGSPLTFWASDEISEFHWLALDLSNSRQKQVRVSSLAVTWGRDHATRYRIMATPDGAYWKPVFQKDNGGGGRDVARFNPPLLVSSIRIEIDESVSRGVSIQDVEIYGDPAEDEPAPPTAANAQAPGPETIQLKWDQADDGVTYFYNVHRAEGRDPAADGRDLVKTTCQREVKDQGLKPGRDYRYLVTAESFGGRRAQSLLTTARTQEGPAPGRFARRGIIEGFYNDPWPHQERLRMITFLEDAGYNYYIYAPKVEPYHRQWHRRPYPEAELRNFAELIAACRAHGIEFNYGISPGLDYDFKGDADREALIAKLESLQALGVRSFTLCFDDIPGRPGKGMAKKQIEAANAVLARLRQKDPEAELLFVPTVYAKTYSYYQRRRSAKARYLRELKDLEPSIGIMWTGPGMVFSPAIEADPARELQELWGRKILIWDNYPVNDAAFRFNVFTGPYVGRDPELPEAVDGIFLNPMYLPNASKIALYTAGRYLNRPGYEPWAAYDEALRFLGGSDAGHQALKALSDCLTPHPIFPELSVERMPIYDAIESFWSDRAAGVETGEAEQRLRGLFTAYARNPADLARHFAGSGLQADLAPLSDKLSLYGQAGVKCLDFMRDPDPDRRLQLRREVLELQTRARLIPWRLADEQVAWTSTLMGARRGNRVILDDFITRVLAEFR